MITPCPKCGQKLRCPDGQSHKLRCPACRHEFWQTAPAKRGGGGGWKIVILLIGGFIAWGWWRGHQLERSIQRDTQAGADAVRLLNALGSMEPPGRAVADQLKLGDQRYQNDQLRQHYQSHPDAFGKSVTFNPDGTTTETYYRK
jgi:hypothetical protein